MGLKAAVASTDFIKDQADVEQVISFLRAFNEEDMGAKDWELAEAAVKLLQRGDLEKDSFLVQFKNYPNHGKSIIASSTAAVATYTKLGQYKVGYDKVACAIVDASMSDESKRSNFDTAVESLKALQAAKDWHSAASPDFFSSFLWKGVSQVVAGAFTFVMGDVSKCVIAKFVGQLLLLLQCKSSADAAKVELSTELVVKLNDMLSICDGLMNTNEETCAAIICANLWVSQLPIITAMMDEAAQATPVTPETMQLGDLKGLFGLLGPANPSLSEISNLFSLKAPRVCLFHACLPFHLPGSPAAV